MRKENPTISLEALEFLIRHPWYFIYPFVIISCVTIVYVTSLPPRYQCEAVVSLKSGFSVIGGAGSTQKKDSLVANVLLGQNIKEIVKAVWPDVSEETNPIMHNALLRGLRNPKGGISIQSDRNDPNLAHISFSGINPQVCYKVVQSTIDVLKLENKNSSNEFFDSNSLFLTRQLSFYREKLGVVDAEIYNVATKLKEMAGGLKPEQRELIYRITQESTLEQPGGQGAVQGDAGNVDIVADLEMQLIDAKKRKQVVEMRINSKNFDITRNVSQDPGLQQELLDKTIAEKKIAMNNLVARGFLPAHPDMKLLQNNIDNLEQLRDYGLQESTKEAERPPTETEKKLAEQKALKELEELNVTVDTLSEKIAAMKDTAGTLPIEAELVGPVAVEAARLRELKDEKSIVLRYYSDLRKQLEDTDLRSRAERASMGFIIDIVEPPKTPVTPLTAQKINKLFFGLMMAIGAGSALSYVVDSLDRSFRTAAELREMFKIPVLASIDRIYTYEDSRADRMRMRSILFTLLAISAGAMILVKIAIKLRII